MNNETLTNWQPTPILRWKKCGLRPREFKVAGIGVGAVAPQEYYVLQQLWFIKYTTHSKWLDVPTATEGDE